MNPRAAKLRRSAGLSALLMALTAFAGPGCGSHRSGATREHADATPATATPALALHATGARIERTLIRVEAALENRSGGPRTLRTNFASVFDGVQVELLAADGRVLATRHYTYHQSPYTSVGRPVVLARGRTAQPLWFIFEPAPSPEAVRVRLVGQRRFYGTAADLRSAVIPLVRLVKLAPPDGPERPHAP